MLRHFISNSVKLLFFIILASTQQRTFAYKNKNPYYEKYIIEELGRICSRGRRETTIKLGINSYPHGLIIFPGNADALSKNFNIDGELNCKFIVQARSGYNLFATIQSMDFEKNGTECSSYVQFTGSSQWWRKRHCGYFHKETPNDFSEMFLPAMSYEHKHREFNKSGVNLGFNAYDKEITTNIFIQDGRRSFEAMSRLIIVFTLNRCSLNQVPFGSESDISRQECISQDYICDGIENCYDSCNDEENCSIGFTMKLLIGAISLFFLALVIGYCIRQNMCCKNTRPPVIERSPSRPFDDLDIYTIAVGSRDLICPPTLDDSTLPSYESLFPEQSNRPS